MKFNCQHCDQRLEIEDEDLGYYQKHPLLNCPKCNKEINLSIIFKLKKFADIFIGEHEKLRECEHALLKLYIHLNNFLLGHVEKDLADYSGSTYEIQEEFYFYVDAVIRKLFLKNKILSQMAEKRRFELSGCASKTEYKNKLIESLEASFYWKEYGVYSNYETRLITVTNTFQTVAYKIFNETHEAFTKKVEEIIAKYKKYREIYRISEKSDMVYLDIVEENILPYNIENFENRFLGSFDFIFEGEHDGYSYDYSTHELHYFLTMFSIVPDGDSVIDEKSDLMKFLVQKGFVVEIQ